MVRITLLLLGSVALGGFPISADEFRGIPLAPYPSPLQADGQNSAREQSVGFYSNGSLKNADQLAAEGEGFLKLFRKRDRAWGSGDLISVLQDVAQHMRLHFPNGERLQIGDMSAKDGGRISGHASHQNGLDVDIAYFRVNGFEESPDFPGGFREEFVKNGRLTENFDLERNWELMKALHATGTLDRVFVDGVIKRELCKHAEKLGEKESAGEVLRKLRPWPNHADHAHLRLKCPANSPKCVSQAAPPAGDGCAHIDAEPLELLASP